MLLISTNLVQLFGSDHTPRGWIRCAWVDPQVPQSVVVAVMTVLPTPELQLLTAFSCPDDLLALDWNKNCVPLRPFLQNKQVYQRAALLVLCANALDLQAIMPPIEVLLPLQQAVGRAPTVPAGTALESSFLLWFWDLVLPQFGVPETTETAWNITTLHAHESDTSSDESWHQAMQTWKDLTTPATFFPPASKDQVLFTCYEGHAVDYLFFCDYVSRVNDALRAILNNQIQLGSTTWLPVLMCPERGCCQQVTANYVTRKAILMHQPPPRVAETASLLRALKEAWGI